MEQGTIDDVKQRAKAAKGKVTMITGHWSAGRYEPNSVDLQDYHILILSDGKLLLRNDFSETLAHTWHQNTGNIGVALAACFGATLKDLGQYAPTDAQINSMAKVIKTLCSGLGLSVDDCFKTHAERAIPMGYGPGSGDPETRWDLWILRNGDIPGTGGDKLRELAKEVVL